uniref:Uncharacterized protein n=1 Tax=Noccaea caerulescens TaxID=107243 RepID=A0A1J3EA97_NOCCA
MVLISEMTTPEINLRWYLDISGLKQSKSYLINGVAIFLAWLVSFFIKPERQPFWSTWGTKTIMVSLCIFLKYDYIPKAANVISSFIKVSANQSTQWDEVQICSLMHNQFRL